VIPPGYNSGNDPQIKKLYPKVIPMSNTTDLPKGRMLYEKDLAELRELLTALQENGGLVTPAILLKPLAFPKAVGGIAAGTTFPVGTAHAVILEQLAALPVRKKRTPQNAKDDKTAAKSATSKANEDIRVIGVTVGALSDGDVIPARITRHELLKLIFQKRN